MIRIGEIMGVIGAVLLINGFLVVVIGQLIDLRGSF